MSLKQIFYSIITLVFLSSSQLSFGQSSALMSETEQRAAKTQFEHYAKEKFLAEEAKHSIITDAYVSGGVKHIYFQQEKEGIPILHATGAVHMVADQVFGANIKYVAGAQFIIADRLPTITANKALESLSDQKGYTRSKSFKATDQTKGKNKAQLFQNNEISHDNIPISLVYVPSGKENLILAFSIAINEVQGDEYYNALVDAETGLLIEEISWTVNCTFDHAHDDTCEHNDADVPSKAKSKEHHTDVNLPNPLFLMPNSYNVFPWPIESPNFGVRSFVNSPWLDNTVASPNGWHTVGPNSFTTTQGNNVDAYDDSNNTNSPTGGDDARADGGVDLNFDFVWDVAGDQTTYKDAAVTNLFYWANVTHDVWFNYGFDEASGNFQEENFTANGAASDAIRCEAQDGSGTCNANMSTPPDGSNPRTQMYLCDNNGTDRDGDYDNGVIVHEYGHGISIRQTGGPANSGCLNNSEQMGEGWSDYFGMVMTIEPGDAGADSRGMGTWLFGEQADGDGIRPFPYSTDFGVNPMTYNTIGSGVSVPHGVGSVWCTMLWDMTWALIDAYGFDTDIYEGNGGNNIAMKLVNEALKIQPCSPGFVDGRDAILVADQMFFNGDNQCLIWDAFARRGLGFSADQGGSGSVSDGNEAFDLPPSCTIGIEKTTQTTEAFPSTQIVYSITITNNTEEVLNMVQIVDTLPANTLFVSASDNAINDNGTIKWPKENLGVGGTRSVTLTVQVDPQLDGNVPDVADDMENGGGQWEIRANGSTDWNLIDTTSSSGNFAWFAPDAPTPGIANMEIVTAKGITENTFLSFSHWYNTEIRWDGGVVEISTDEGGSWEDLGGNMIQNGYNNTIYNSRPGFSGNSGGYITTVVDLSSYANQNALIRFQMNCDQAVGGDGWFIDDVLIANLALFIQNEGLATDGILMSTDRLDQPTLVISDGNTLESNITKEDVSCFGFADGEMTATAVGGSGNYTYLWSNDETTSTISNLAAGTYFATISDGTNSMVRFGTIEEPDELILTAGATPVVNGTAGSALVLIEGGVAPYNILWSNGETSALITDLAAGIYTVDVTDANLCAQSAQVEVIDPFGGCTNRRITFNIQFDQWPEESSYILMNMAGDTVASAGPFDPEVTPDGALFSDFLCLEDGCYTLAVRDAYGDGNCANYSNPQGYFEMLDEQGNELISLCDFGFGDTLSVRLGDVPMVMNNADDGEGSLRSAIDLACPNDTIFFDGALMDETIILTSGEIELNRSVMIKGLGMNNLTINGGGTGRIFAILEGVPVYIENVTLKGVPENLEGNAILNAGELTIKDVRVEE